MDRLRAAVGGAQATKSAAERRTDDYGLECLETTFINRIVTFNHPERVAILKSFLIFIDSGGQRIDGGDEGSAATGIRSRISHDHCSISVSKRRNRLDGGLPGKSITPNRTSCWKRSSLAGYRPLRGQHRTLRETWKRLS